MLICVTGGLGYIGSHIVIELAKRQEFEILIVDNLINCEIATLEKLRVCTKRNIFFKQVELTNSVAVYSIFREYPIDLVIHCAALKSVPESKMIPMQYIENNVMSTLNLLRAMESFGLRNFIFSSSCSVYGNPQDSQVNEETPIGEAVSPYALSKQMCEQVIKVSKCKSIILRYFNPAGAHPNLPMDAIGLIPILVKNPKLTIFGTDYNTKDGTAVRDYVHIYDIAIAHVAAVDKVYQMQKGQKIMNLGSGTPHSVLEVVRKWEEITKSKKEIFFTSRRFGDVESVFANNDKAQSELGWKPQLTLVDILNNCLVHN